jgi:hypothetical protein
MYPGVEGLDTPACLCLRFAVFALRRPLSKSAKQRRPTAKVAKRTTKARMARQRKKKRER